MKTVRDVSGASYVVPAPVEASGPVAQLDITPAPVAMSHWLRVPAWVWVIGVLAALIHMAPYLRALAVTPEGYEFTGNLSLSPDYMQYRVWMRQTQLEGPFVSDVFTTEPNARHLPVPLYWTLGKLSSWTGISPEWMYAWFGAVLAVAFAVVLYSAVRRFLRDSRATPWVFATLMFGGGLGAYLRFLEQSALGRESYAIQFLFLQPLRGANSITLFESYRGNYIVQALFDTHFLTFWLITTVAVLALHTTVRNFSPARLAMTAALFAFGTFVHVYEGLTLLAIAVGALAIVGVRRAAPWRVLLWTAGACGAAVALTLLPLAYLAGRSGLPAPVWRGENIVFAVFILGYPLALGLIVWGFGKYWREAGLDEAFLIGWALACTAIVLSGPFFPYPDRGTMTLQIPLFIIGAAIWFRRHHRVGVLGVVLVVLLLGSTPAWIAKRNVERTTFNPALAYKWIGPAQKPIQSALATRAARGEVLVADQANLRWIAPIYPGVHYAGHFFLTVDFEEKQDALRRFYESSGEDERLAFLDRWRVRWLFVDDVYDVDRFTNLPGLTIAAATPAGTLFEVNRSTRHP